MVNKPSCSPRRRRVCRSRWFITASTWQLQLLPFGMVIDGITLMYCITELWKDTNLTLQGCAACSSRFTWLLNTRLKRSTVCWQQAQTCWMVIAKHLFFNQHVTKSSSCENLLQIKTVHSNFLVSFSYWGLKIDSAWRVVFNSMPGLSGCSWESISSRHFTTTCGFLRPRF